MADLSSIIFYHAQLLISSLYPKDKNVARSKSAKATSTTLPGVEQFSIEFIKE